MHSKDKDSARITESTGIEDYFERETHFIGDSYTAEQLATVIERMETGFDEIKRQLKHLCHHDPSIMPVPGCEFCEVRRAA